MIISVQPIRIRAKRESASTKLYGGQNSNAQPHKGKSGRRIADVSAGCIASVKYFVKVSFPKIG